MKFKHLIVVSLFTCNAIMLAGCGQQNPMLNDETIKHLKNLLTIDSPSFPSIKCTNYYANSMQDSNNKDMCEAWSEKVYKMERNAGNLPSGVTLNDFRDSQVWKRVQPSK